MCYSFCYHNPPTLNKILFYSIVIYSLRHWRKHFKTATSRRSRDSDFRTFLSLSLSVCPDHKNPDVISSTFTNATKPRLNEKDPKMVQRWVDTLANTGRRINISEDFSRSPKVSPGHPRADHHFCPWPPHQDYAFSGSFSCDVCDSCWDNWTNSTTKFNQFYGTLTQRYGERAIHTYTVTQFDILFFFFFVFLTPPPSPYSTLLGKLQLLKSPAKDESERVNDRRRLSLNLSLMDTYAEYIHLSKVLSFTIYCIIL